MQRASQNVDTFFLFLYLATPECPRSGLSQVQQMELGKRCS